MKSVILAFALMVTGATMAAASCPPGTSYNCYSTYNGKQSCGCR